MNGLQLDHVTRVVNVQWEEGLAVIFGPHDTDAPPFKQEEPAIAISDAKDRKVK